MSIQQNFPAISPSLSLNFARSKTLDPRITFTRTSSGTRTNETGLVEVVPANSPRFDHSYDPVSGSVRSLGLLVEESRVNSIRNNTMVGASVGTSPTNWTPINRSGLTWSIAGTGIDSGVYYVDIRLSGTSNATSSPTFTFEEASQISASNGQTWSTSCFIKLVSGTTNGITQIILAHDERSGTYLTGGNSDNFLSSINSSTTNIFSSCRYPFTRTNTNASTTFLLPYLLVTPTNGAVIDMTLRIGMPQTELGAFVTTVIPTSGSTVTRTPDNVSMVGENFSDWYNQEQGSFLWIGNVYSREISPVQPFRVNQGANLRGLGIQFDTRSINNSTNFASRTQSSNIPSKIAPSGIIPSDNKIKIAGGYIESVGLSTIRAAFNGLPEDSYSGYTQTDITYDTMNELEIMGNRGISGTNYQFTGVCEQLVYYPRILSDDQLQNLTK